MNTIKNKITYSRDADKLITPENARAYIIFVTINFKDTQFHM